MPVPARYYHNKFNRGEVDPLALARDDVTKVINSGRLMTNFMPIRLGAMQYRPGMEHLDEVNDTSQYCIPFVAATDDTAILEFSASTLRVWVDDELIERTAVTTSVTNGDFTSNISSWTDNDDSGATSAHVSGGYLGLTGTGTASASRYQTISPTETGAEHACRITIDDAPVLVEIGTSGANSDDIFSGELDPGIHSLVFTPDNDITITFSNSKEFRALVDSVEFESAGTLELPTDVTASDLSSIRWAQSADVVFIAWQGGKHFKIERRGIKSWSVAEYHSDDGPFGTINNTDITLTPGALSGGNVTLTASKDYFESTDVDTLFRLVSSGQVVERDVTAEDTGTDSIQVTGVETSRQFLIEVTGLNGTGSTIVLQRSADNLTFTDVEAYTANTTKTFDDGFDNAILFYRLHCKSGDYSSGTHSLQLDYAGGSIEGICRVISHTSATVVRVNVLKAFGKTEATRDWHRGEWDATENGYPTAVALYEGRLWWGGRTRVWGSVSDAYTSFDDSIEGNSKPIARTIGFGPVDNVLWLLPLSRLIMGIASDELAIRSSSFGEILTDDNANIKTGSNQGVAAVDPLYVNQRGYFVQRSLTKIYELLYSLNDDSHQSDDLTLLNPSICSPGIKRIAVTVQPEIRIYVVLDDGTARVYLMDRSEDVAAWSRIETDGDIKDVIVLPATTEDRVYFVVQRDSGYLLEKLALFSEAEGGNISKHWDSFVQYSSPGTTLTGLSHLEGKTVHVWADGQYRESATVSGGSITVSDSWADVVVGLRHTADYTTSALRYKDESTLTYLKRVVNVGFVIRNYWPGSIQVGPDSNTLDDFPDMEDGKQVDMTATQDLYVQTPFPFNGAMQSDPKIHLQATNPCMIMAMTYGIEDAEDEESGQTQSTEAA